jgi:hypothetical protein
VSAECLAPPAVVVDEPTLGDQPARVVVDPVPRKGAGPAQALLDGAVAVDGQGQGGPGHPVMPTAAAMLAAMEACAHAARGDASPCLRALMEAERAFERSSPSEDPPRVDFDEED